MKFWLITAYLQRRARGKLRSALRGYRVLKAANQLDRIASVKEVFMCSRLAEGWVARGLIFGAGLNTAELSVRQFLLARIGGIKLGHALQSSLGNPKHKVSLPLPPEWRKLVVQNGFNVSPIQANLNWIGYIAIHYLYGLALLLIKTIAFAKSLVLNSNPILGRYVYFVDLVPNALPSKEARRVSYDVVTWYAKKMSIDKKIDTVCHGLKNTHPTKAGELNVLPLDGPLPKIDRLGSLLKFFVWGIAASFTALFDMLCGKWVSALMLPEAVKSAHARYLNPNYLAQEYLFSNSSFIYRPLWTYEIEDFGRRVILYFYSANCEPFKRSYGYANFSIANYKLMNWPNYLVWDQHQADFIRREVEHPAAITIVGPIWFTTGVEELPILPSVTVAVFDVQPVRASFYQRLGIEFDFYTPANVISFLADSTEACQRCGAMIALKRKRKIGNLIHHEYEIYVENINKRHEIIVIDPDVSAYELIKSSLAVISMPFTSTALIGVSLGKPSVYYDPRKMLQKDDRASHGIPILQGPQELQEWLSSVIPSRSEGMA